MAPADPNLYEVLGVARTASPAEVRKAYLRRAREHHPDFHTTAAATARAASEREMQRINEAWAVLSDIDRRRAYDDRGRVDRRDDAPSVHRPGAASYDFVPIDDGPDIDYAAELDDTPVAGTEVPWVLQMLPVVLLLGGAGALIVGAIIQLGALVAFGVIGIVLGLLGFLATPAVAVARSLQAERDP